MNLHFFHIPAIGGASEAEELNRFLASGRVRDLERRFVEDGAASFWAVAVTMLDDRAPNRGPSTGRSRIDYKAELSEQQFAVFARLREVRKQLAEREAVPAYSVATNAQLAEMVTAELQTATALARIEGFGEARVRKFGDALLGILRTAFRPATEEQQQDGKDEAVPSDDRGHRGPAQPG